MDNSNDTFKDESWIALYPLTASTTEPTEDEQGPKISPILIFFLFLILDAFIIAVFYFCYFMRTKSIKPRIEPEQQGQDKPPPYQIAVLEDIYPSVTVIDEESSMGELPSYDDTITKNTNLHLPPSNAVCSDIDMTVKMT